MVAYALETHTDLLRYLPELLSDLEELGSDSKAITRVLFDLELEKSATVVDLGCGTGAAALAIAGGLNLKVVGIDLFRPFVEICDEQARRQGLAGLCQFIHGDVLQLAGCSNPAM